jgi:hypothetical protein
MVYSKKMLKDFTDSKNMHVLMFGHVFFCSGKHLEETTKSFSYCIYEKNFKNILSKKS